MRDHFPCSRFKLAGAALLAAFASVPVQAAVGVYYDPTNAASPTGKTIGYELFSTIGCPGKQLFDTGCPIPPPDSDGDGVIDAKDKCPGTPAGRKVNADGCELDGDGDGVVDARDKCPDTPPGRTVNSDGCEIDTDGDGLVDGVDKCPTVYAKTDDGCPPPPPPSAPALERLRLNDVNFDYDRATLRPEARAKLDEAAETLKKWGDVDILVEGHTDSRGTDAYNQSLSQRRAGTVRTYLIDRGISANRLQAVGKGESEPVADNATAEGRLENRRVELIQTR